jgi:hypothetical protein
VPRTMAGDIYGIRYTVYGIQEVKRMAGQATRSEEKEQSRRIGIGIRIGIETRIRIGIGIGIETGIETGIGIGIEKGIENGIGIGIG